ncbi:MAG: hypothetical protein AAFU85_15965 [Planctomycetota bacterium]
MIQLLTEFVAPHGWVALLLCVLGTSVASYLWAGRGFAVSVLFVGVAYVILDQRWLRSEMDVPGWGGTPDQDAVFYLGVGLRLMFMAIILFFTFSITRFFASRFDVRKAT